MAPYIPIAIDIPKDPDGINCDVTSPYEKWLKRIPWLLELIWLAVFMLGTFLATFGLATFGGSMLWVGIITMHVAIAGFFITDHKKNQALNKKKDEQRELSQQMEHEQYPYLAGAEERACTTSLIVLHWWIDGDVISIRFRNGDITRTLQFPVTAVEREYGIHKAVIFPNLEYRKTGNGKAELCGWDQCNPVLFDPTFPVRYPVFDPETLQSVTEADTESDGMPVTLGSLLTHLRHLPLDQLQPWQVQAAIKQLESDAVVEPLKTQAATVAAMLRDLLKLNETAAIQRGLLDLKAQLSSKVAGLAALNELTEQTLKNGGDPNS